MGTATDNDTYVSLRPETLLGRYPLFPPFPFPFIPLLGRHRRHFAGGPASRKPGECSEQEAYLSHPLQTAAFLTPPVLSQLTSCLLFFFSCSGVFAPPSVTFS